MKTPGYPRLLGDVGGTNARFAWQEAPGQALSDIRALPAAEFPTLEAAIRYYLTSGSHGQAREACIGIANPVVGDVVKMTNHHWGFSISAMQQALALDRFLLINDFTALALSLPDLAAHELRLVGGSGAESPLAARAAKALIGPGTGLGVSGLLPAPGGHWVALAGEGGHVSLAAANPREEAVVRWLQQRFGHASAERAVSGQGLENLYCALTELDGTPGNALSAAEVSSRALAATNAHCQEALALFCTWLGSLAGNLALTLGATGGVYLGGGILPRLGSYLDQSAFRQRFEAKGRFQPLLAQIPVWVIEAEQSPALLGAARALEG